MNSVKFDAAIDANAFRFLALGFRQSARSSLLCRLRRNDGCEVEFAGERYSDQMTISISGGFCRGEQLIVALLAQAVSGEHFERIRASETARDTIDAVVQFLNEHLDAIVQNSEPVLERYERELARWTAKCEQASDESSSKPKKGSWWRAIKSRFWK